ncbi:MAG: glycosyl hydrolase [Firmicutes bacterium]|nr:glycosyl hydrolase [Bacillota bacterium]
MIDYGKAVCYSGYRENQSPMMNKYPTYKQVLEDLQILEKYFNYIRMYDISEHVKTVLQVIRENNISLKVMLGVEPRGEISNPNCPWGGLHSIAEIEHNKVFNFTQLDGAALIANEYKDIVFAVSVGNESTSDWHSNLMEPSTIASHARYLKSKISQPITFCEGGYYWKTKGNEIAKEVDFISIHSYPLWLRVPLEKAVETTLRDYQENKDLYPDKQIIFTEFGWASKANEKMDSTQANEEFQSIYFEQMEKWSETSQVIMFVFEAFDEPWKGSKDLLEPEKHWGIFNVDRTPKLYYQKHSMLRKE